MVDIEKLAFLARIKLTPLEKEKLQKEFKKILDYISKLKKIDIRNIANNEVSKTTNLENVMREDEDGYEAGEFSEKLLKEVPSVEKGYVKVKHILE
jgi:aspartyl-tRNA(Asn)/glutamyl-tRNA(Gln) amidotransferase subunit C